MMAGGGRAPPSSRVGHGFGRVGAAAVGGHADPSQNDHGREFGVDRHEAAGFDAVADHGGDLGPHMSQLATQHGAPGNARPLATTLGDADQRLEPADLREHEHHDRRQALRRRCRTLRDAADARLELGQRDLQRLDVQHLLGHEVPIDRGLGDAGRAGNVGHLHHVVRRCRKQPRRRL